MPVFNSKCNWINWVPTKELYQQTLSNLHYQPHTETKSPQSDSSEVLLRPLLDVQKAQHWPFHELQLSEFWAPPAVWQPWCEDLGAHTPSCLHEWDDMCRLCVSTEICIPHWPELHWSPTLKLLWTNTPPALLFAGNLLWQWHDLISSFNLCIFMFKSV